MLHSSSRTSLGLVAALGAFLLASLLSVGPAVANHGTASGHSFTFLQAPFTQEVFGVGNFFMGGVAFAPDGDPLVDECNFSGSPLHRYDRQGVAPEVNATRLHPETTLPSNAGCGLTNHPDGTLYTNTDSGVVNLDASTGAQLRGPFGPAGNALGIAPDPQTGNLVYVGSNGTIQFVNQTFTTSGTFSTVTTGHFVDGIYFDPTGDFLFTADRSGGAGFQLTIIRRDGSLAQSVPMSSEPDGIAFRAAPPRFVVTNNLDGTMTRFDFPGDDFTQTPTQSTFASGGFRGDLAQVGPDGCLYVTQAGTRYDNDATSSENSLVRICPGFAPPPGIEGPPGNANCSDGIDNDGDGLVDTADPDCQGPEGPPGDPTCSDGIDNDGDGLVDGADPDCGPGTEGPPGNPNCSDGIDNDGDGLVDADDPDCLSGGGPTSQEQCKKGGWKAFGFRNQGQCIRFVNTGKR